MKKLCLILFVVTFYTSLSLAADDYLPLVKPDSVELHVKEVEKYFNSNNWVPSDSAAYRRLVSLLNYIENPSIEIILRDIKSDINNENPLFIKSDSRVKNPQGVKGYIGDRVRSQQLNLIEKEVREHYPDSSIFVKEELFIGMYARLPLILKSNMYQMLEDSLVVLPDNLKQSDSKEENSQQSLFLASKRDVFLDSVRIAYNNQLINSYRDSITHDYRNSFIQKKISEAQALYVDSVNSINKQVLTAYGDSVTNAQYNQLESSIEALLTYANQIPNPLFVYNLRNDTTLLLLENDMSKYQWVWLKNFQNDSVGVKIENIDRHGIRILVDESLNLSRITQQNSKSVDRLLPQNEMKVQLKKVTHRKPIVNPWSYGGTTYAGFTQTYINDYWAKGGNSSASVLTTLNYYANYSTKKIKWENSADVKLGLIRYKKDSLDVRNLHKNSDNIDLISKLGVSAFRKWYYSAILEFKTQAFRGFKNQRDTIVRSSFFNPADLKLSIGFDYKPNKDFSLFLSPISLKTTYVLNQNVAERYKVDERSYGLDEGATRKSRIGMSAKLDLKRKLMEDVTLQTKNSMFVNFGNNAEGESLWYKFPDLDSETTINFKVNQFISTQLNAQFIYNKDVTATWTDGEGVAQSGTKLQVKEFFTLGVSYKF